jgi:hypothetical protein
MISIIAAEWSVCINNAKFLKIESKKIIFQKNKGDSQKAKLFINFERSKYFFINVKNLKKWKTKHNEKRMKKHNC